jgi:WD40 repeat protein
LDQLDPILGLPEAPDPDHPAVAFGRFRLTRRVGAGRFGVVLLADDPQLRRRVVVKVPQPAVLTDLASRERFVREARSAARLDHPGIVPVFEAGELNGLPYLVAGYVDGTTLGEWLRAQPGPVPPAAAARLVVKLAAAVQHAHERGVLHCDLSPSNVLLASAGGTDPEPVITDFGLARLTEDDPTLTRTYQVAGTPLYMAPEQARGDRRTLTARADVYALGVILYELLTGRPPFAAESGDLVISRVIQARPEPPRRANSAVPRDLQAVCLRCLEKDPADRYPTADALADDLGRFLAGRPTAARPVGPFGQFVRLASRNPAYTALFVVALAALCAVPAVAAWYSVRLEEEALGRRQAERDADRDRELADTREFFASLERVRVRRLERPPEWVDANLADLRTLAGLPPAADHRHDLRTEAAAALAAVDLCPVRTLAEGFMAYAPAYSPDGATLALCGWQARDDGTGVVRLYDVSTGRLFRELTFPIDPNWSNQTDRPDGCRVVAFSPDGRWLVAGTRGGQLARWDLSSADPGPVVWTAHTDDHPDPRQVWVMALAFTADGQTLYSSTREATRGWSVPRNWEPTGARHDFVIPGGTPLLGDRFPVMRRVDRLSELGYFDPRAGTTRTTGVRAFEIFAASRDGRVAAVCAVPDDTHGLTGTEAGARPRALLTADRTPTVELSIEQYGFGPGDGILATSEEHERRIKLWDVASGQVVTDRVAGGGSVRFAFSPDGRHLAVTEDEKAVVYEVTGRVRETLAVGPRQRTGAVAVRSDGRALVVVQHDPFKLAELTTLDVAPDRPPVILARRENAGGIASGLAAFAPDGSTFAYNATSLGSDRERVEYSDGTAVACERVSDLRFAPDGRLWAAEAHRVRVWTLPGWQEECPLENEAAARDAGMVFRAAAPGRRVSAIGRRDGRVFLLPAAGPAPPPRRVFASAVTSLALSPGEEKVLAGGERGEVIAWGVADGTITVLPDAHRDAVWSAAYGPGGWFVTGSADRTIRLWDADGRPVLTLRAGGGVRKVAVSSDGRLLTVLVDGERAVRRWRLAHLRDELAALGLDPGLP